jgi:hypothetical protein
MIKSTLDGSVAVGAGIVLGSSGQDLYLATADHLVRTREGGASEVRVQLWPLRGEWFPAVLTDLREQQLDIAILKLMAPPGRRWQATDFPTRLAVVSSALQRRDEVYPVGFPHEKAWGMPVKPDRVESVGALRIVFESSYVSAGSSGGGLLDGCGRLAGMVVTSAPPEAQAVKIDLLLDAARGWGVPIFLTAVSSRCHGAESELSIGQGGQAQATRDRVGAPTGAVSARVGAFRITVDSCRKEERRVDCSGLVANESRARESIRFGTWLGGLQGASIVDDRGHQSPRNRFRLGSGGPAQELEPETPVAFEITEIEVSPDASYLTLSFGVTAGRGPAERVALKRVPLVTR